MTDDLEEIEAAYRRYEDQGRNRLWSPRNPGYRRLAAERTAALVSLIARSAAVPHPCVLDVGCGDGTLANHARTVVPSVKWTGVDLRADAVEEARRHVPWAEFVQASADALPFGTASFDVAVNSVFMSSVPSASMRRAIAQEFGRVLRPGGWLVWYDLRYDNPTNRSVHGIGRMELAQMFPGWRSDLASISLIPPLARRLGPLTGLLYPALHRMALLRSHLVGRLMRPHQADPSP